MAEEQDPDIVRMSSEGIDSERSVIDLLFETRYCEIKDVIPAGDYLRIIGDDDFTDVEIRILHKTLNALGWTLSDESKAARLAKDLSGQFHARGQYER